MSKRSTHQRKKRAKSRVKKGKKRTKVSRGCIAWRLVKGIVFIICLILFFYQSAKFLQVYYMYPTTTKIEFTYPNEFEFPAVTFCNHNPMKRSTFCAQYPNLCERPANITEVCEINPSLCNGKPSDLVIPKLGFLTNDSTEEVITAILEVYYSGNTTREFWEKWAWNIETKNKMQPVFVLYSGMYFACFSENLLLNSTRKSKKIYLGSGKKQRILISYDLNIQRSEQISMDLEPYAFLAIHSPFVPVNPFDQGNLLKLGHKYNIKLQLEEKNLLPFPYVTKCTVYEDSWSKDNPQRPRSQEMCQELCLHNSLEPNKIMATEFQMLEFPLKLCSDSECEFSEDTDIFQQCRRDCKPSCRNLMYTSTVMETVLDNPRQKESPDFDSERDKIQVEIFLGNHQVVVESHVPLYDTGHLFSYIGGLMGCWLGVSIWAFAGIAENVFRRSLQWMERIKRFLKKTSRTSHAVFANHRRNVLKTF